MVLLIRCQGIKDKVGVLGICPQGKEAGDQAGFSDAGNRQRQGGSFLEKLFQVALRTVDAGGGSFFL